MDYINIIIFLIALLFSAFFSGMKVAFLNVNLFKLEIDNQQGSFSGRILSRFIKNDRNFIATMLIGNILSLTVLVIWMAKLLDNPLGIFVKGNDGLIILLQIIIAAITIIVLTEFLPKATFQINPNRILKILVFPLMFFYVILYPLTQLFMGLSNVFFRIFKIKPKKTEVNFSKVGLDDYVRDLNERMEIEGNVENEVQILQNALDFSGVKARDCMIPRTDIVAMEFDSSIEDLRQKFVETGLSKIIIYRDSIDNIIGYAHGFELFKKPKSIKEVLIPLVFVPEATTASDLLKIFQQQHGNIAIVLDEFGGTSGLVTIEDVIEEIFGDIEDEHDKDNLLEQQIDATTFRLSARHDIDYLNETYDLGLEESSEYETIGGLVLHHLESIPVEGTTLDLEKHKIKIESVSDRRIETVELKIIDLDT
ncbi:MAG: hemolysin family protein [Brumimicrobium sp.]